MAEIIAQYGPVIIVSGTCSAILVTLFLELIRNNIAVRIKTFETIERWSNDQSINKMFSEFRSVLNGNRYPIYDESRYENIQDHEKLIFVMNFYETIAVGVKSRVLHYKTIKEWWESSFVLHFLVLQPYIQMRRQLNANPNEYCEFEKLAMKWLQVSPIDQQQRAEKALADYENKSEFSVYLPHGGTN